jgi:16S rRNA (cytosine1407-C5)-methyltransferase
MARSRPTTRPRDDWQRFLARASEATGLSTGQLTERLRGTRSTSVRVNPLHPDGAEAITAELLERWPAIEPVPGDPHSWFCSEAAPCHEMIPLADQGRVYLQNAASLLPVLALDVEPGQRVLDVAAAPGGKAFNIAGKLGAGGELWLNDAIRPRRRRLEELAALHHVIPAVVTEHKAQYLDKYLTDERFDRILLDAQCTGEGRFDLRKRSALRYWSEERVREYSHVQTKMMVAASRLLAPGGVLVYSTCTIAPEENEVAVSRALGRRDDLDIAELGLDPGIDEVQPGLIRWQGKRLDPRVAATGRTLPGGRFEAFYVAKLILTA